VEFRALSGIAAGARPVHSDGEQLHNGADFKVGSIAVHIATIIAPGWRRVFRASDFGSLFWRFADVCIRCGIVSRHSGSIFNVAN